ncbi:MAG TPA: GAF domain-containing sensor histidine kinase [Luteibacter sp.]|uniref:GAF domain-containing sensor histidine kinase n=1 Tax=Luteibacter sp. TaxID=1886636 RepID=UPI002C7DDDB0|nr:GAF domain-containing sensor histidine kinase [Luteibacter sp.]HVI55797.1 GAF domain-containing sensor histidine kinase [Luteibacter sp.]
MGGPGDILQTDIDESVAAIARLSVVPRILDAVVRATGMRFAAVARVTENRWTACAVRDELGFGLQPGEDLVLETTICNDIRSHRQPVVFGNASAHAIYSQHHTPQHYGLQSYASVPIYTVGGEFFGTLCAIDSRPLAVDEEKLATEMTLYGELIASHMALEGRLAHAERALRSSMDEGVLREQFLAVVGHDLRSPLQAAGMAAESLADMDLPPRAGRLAKVITASARRMADLIDDIMDFARARLASGIPVAQLDQGDLGALVARVVTEVAAAHPAATIVSEVDMPGNLRFDPVRLQQLLANLLNNAIAHGDTRRAIRVDGRAEDDAIVLAVTNFGTPIDPATQGMLFQPFYRPESATPRPGLGLGLYIASEIARAHGGTLTVCSSAAEGTCFTLRLPLIGA